MLSMRSLLRIWTQKHMFWPIAWMGKPQFWAPKCTLIHSLTYSSPYHFPSSFLVSPWRWWHSGQHRVFGPGQTLSTELIPSASHFNSVFFSEERLKVFARVHFAWFKVHTTPRQVVWDVFAKFHHVVRTSGYAVRAILVKVGHIFSQILSKQCRAIRQDMVEAIFGRIWQCCQNWIPT